MSDSALPRIVFATNNDHKISEVRAMLQNKYEVIGLKDIEWTDEIPEPFDTIPANAQYKAEYFYNHTKQICVAEDSGLCIDALDGAPGVYSARYAGPQRSDTDNLKKVLADMQGKEDRNAKFVSVFAFSGPDISTYFMGEMYGKIIDAPQGSNGFGYDPIFMADGQSRSNAELNPEEKNAISHRKQSLSALIDYLETHYHGFD